MCESSCNVHLFIFAYAVHIFMTNTCLSSGWEELVFTAGGESENYLCARPFSPEYPLPCRPPRDDWEFSLKDEFVITVWWPPSVQQLDLYGYSMPCLTRHAHLSRPPFLLLRLVFQSTSIYFGHDMRAILTF